MSIEKAIDGHLMAKVARLREMGFEDEALSKTALEQVGCNVNLAIEKILSGGLSVPAPPKDEARPSAGGAGASSTPAASSCSGLASIFNLSQRPSSSAHTIGTVGAGASGQKPRSRPTAASAKPNRPLVRAATTAGCNSAGMGQASLTMLPLKRKAPKEVEGEAAGQGSGPVSNACPGGGLFVVESDDESIDSSSAVPRDARAGLAGAKSVKASEGANSQGPCASHAGGSVSTGAGVMDSLTVQSGAASAESKRARGELGGNSAAAAKGEQTSLDAGCASIKDTGAENRALGCVEGAPLAERMRPHSWDCFVGQASVRKIVDGLCASPANLPSLILWGPPGCGQSLPPEPSTLESGPRIPHPEACALNPMQARRR
jgi:hypothetical protein